MTTNNDHPHILQFFDHELEELHDLTLDMTATVMGLLEQTLLAFEQNNADAAARVLPSKQVVDRLEAKIDAEALVLLARHGPVANDLRSIVSTTKIAMELKHIGYQITELAGLTIGLLDSQADIPRAKMLADVCQIGYIARGMLGELLIGLKNHATEPAFRMLQNEPVWRAALQTGIKRQLEFIKQDGRWLQRAMDVIRMIKLLEDCGEHCKHIAEHLILMIDGVDIRHRRALNRVERQTFDRDLSNG